MKQLVYVIVAAIAAAIPIGFVLVGVLGLAVH